MIRQKVFPLVFFLAALALACDLPFVAQEKRATYVEGAPGLPGAPLGNANATAQATLPADANVTPGASTAVATRRATTSRAAAVYVASLRVAPVQPRSGPDPVTFYVRFQITYPSKHSVKWLVKIFRPGETKSFGETSALTTDIPPGTNEIPSANNWHTNPFQCETFIARVFWIEVGLYADPIEFKKPDGVNTPFGEFKVCP